MGIGYREETSMIFHLDTSTIIGMLGGNNSWIKKKFRSIASKNIKILSLLLKQNLLSEL